MQHAKFQIMNTSYIKTPIIRAMLYFSRQMILEQYPGKSHLMWKNVSFVIKTSPWQFSGHCSPYARHIRMKIGTPEVFPLTSTYRGGREYKDMPPYTYHDYLEACLAIIAHEMSHFIWQTHTRDNEEACECLSMKVLKLYRQDRWGIKTRIYNLVAGKLASAAKTEPFVKESETGTVKENVGNDSAVQQ